MNKLNEQIFSLSKSDFMRAKILAAVKSLLQTTSYQDITVTCVCDAAGISRSTFYQLFTNFNDALNWEFGRVFSMALENNSFGDDWRDSFFRLVARALYAFSEESTVFRKIAENMSRVDYDSIFSRTCRRASQLFIDYITTRSGKPLDERSAFEIDFFVRGTSDMIASWMTTQNTKPEVIAEMLTACVPPYLTSVLDQFSTANKGKVSGEQKN